MRKRNIGKSLAIMLAACAFTFASVGEISAKSRSGGGGFSRSSSSSKSSGGWGKSSSSSSKKSTSVTPSNKQQQNKQATGWGSSSKTTQAKPAVSKAQNDYAKAVKSPEYSKMDKAISSSVGKSGKTYTDRAAAKADFEKAALSKTYPAGSARPPYVPPQINGRDVVLVNGRWGSYDPTGTFMAIMAADMIVDNMMLASYGWNPVHHTQPVAVVRNDGGGIVIAVVLGLFCLVLVGFVAIKILG